MKLVLTVALLLFQTPSENIEGVVLRTGSDAPIAGARVTLFRDEAPMTPFRTILTDKAGNFPFTALEPGEYSIGLSGEGYVIQNRLWQLRGITVGTIPVTVRRNEPVRGLRLTLTPEAVVAGRVTGTRGEPLVNTEVQLLVSSTDANGRQTYSTYAAAATNDRGEYRLFGLKAGRYYLRAAEPTLLNSPSIGQIPAGEGLTRYAGTFYPGVLVPTDASVIEVKAGDTLNKMDLMMIAGPAAKYRIQGRIVDAQRTGPLQGVEYTFYPAQSQFETVRRFKPGNPDGTFELTDVAPGTYVIHAMARHLESQSLCGLATVEVVSRDLVGVIVSLKEASEDSPCR